MPNLDKDELLISFRGARNKREQIKILADLNCCAPRTIAQALEELGAFDGTDFHASQFSARYTPTRGVPTKQPAPQPARKAVAQTFDEEIARELFAQGLDDEAIAERLNVKAYRITKWRSKIGLRREYSWRKDSFKGAKSMTKETDAPERNEVLEAKAAAPAQQNAADAAPAQQETPEAAPTELRCMTLGELKQQLGELLPAKFHPARLYIDGTPVQSLYGFSVTMLDGIPTVDLLTRRGWRAADRD